ncbi:energy-coupling factor ABC transporter ATP-binding protein [Mesorhizobium sp. ANAO-SY3R2]|uniref:energy-coupling factor ABC transporter ATP-binding protein n=1 Tax=Mesorhizobium sp. ANAO-SY3R2 TaxID=3166644 RepID=UPI00366DA66B
MNTLISLEHVCVVRDGRCVLDDLSLTLEAGERLALIGSNGAGKTTLLRTIVGLQRATGEILAFGMHCRSEADFRQVRAKAAYLFQDPDDQLFCPTVIDDVAFGPLNLGMLHQEAMDLARTILGELDLGHLADRITHRLSGGEKRLVSLAAVLAMRPQVLLLDEPTNALDEAHLERMLDILSRLPIAMIIVSHDWALLEHLTDRAVILRGGRLIPAMLHRHGQWTEQVHLHELAPGDASDAT